MEERQDQTVIKINLLQVSMTLGTYLGIYITLVYLVTAMTVKYANLTLIAIPMILGIPVVAYMLIRHFRDENCKPFFPFPVSWIITILTFLFATALSCMVAYLYLRFIDHGAFAAGLMEHLEIMIQTFQAEAQTFTDPAQLEQYDKAMELMRQSVTWFCSLPASGVTKQLIQSSLMWGNILSLIIALITAKRLRIK